MGDVHRDREKEAMTANRHGRLRIVAIDCEGPSPAQHLVMNRRMAEKKGAGES
jgi:hypothetical protein